MNRSVFRKVSGISCTWRTMATNKGKEILGVPVSERISDGLDKIDVWTVFSPAGGFVPSDSVNMGQGFMNWAPPQYVREATCNAMMNDVTANHYSHARGRINLRKAISNYWSESYNLGRALDPESEILITAGANEGMYSSAAAFLNPGDEVIIFEPFFDQYPSEIAFNGGKPVFVPIRPPGNTATANVNASEWKIDEEELRAAITPKTRMIWINTPHNPIGKVFNKEELTMIGKIAKENDLLILSDEVYDVLTYGTEHIRIAGLEDFWERTITIGSVGKSFSATGWRVGWVAAPANLIRAILIAHTRIVFCVNSACQEGAAVGFNEAKERDFFNTQRREYEERLKALTEGLDSLGLPYTIPQGSYFVLVNFEQLQIPEDFQSLDIIKNRSHDWRAAWFVAKTAGVVLLPPTDFYSEPHWDIGSKFLRFAFCKDVPTIKQAISNLEKIKPYLKK